MKKMLAFILALTMIFALAACGGSGKSQAAPASEVLTMATSPDFPPFEELQSDGSVVGIEVDLLELICEKLGKTLQIEQMDFDSVLPGVQAGKYDVGVSGISVTEKRQKNVLFTDPYCLAAQAIVVLGGSDITGKADLDGKKIAVQTGTTAESFCMENGYEVSSFAANSDAELALVTGKVDAWVIDDLTAAEMVKAYNAENGEVLVILGEAMTTEPYAFAFAFGSEELVAQINDILKGLVEDGTVAALFEKYDAPYTSPLN
ncbi:MAG: transporter substrate-binding domain-containing protein [Oscillospiraceae bacterium]|nr:transporter substrate-binding domain-containing protein [Oscillospiraceae bacterium]